MGYVRKEVTKGVWDDSRETLERRSVVVLPFFYENTFDNDIRNSQVDTPMYR